MNLLYRFVIEVFVLRICFFTIKVLLLKVTFIYLEACFLRKIFIALSLINYWQRFHENFLSHLIAFTNLMLSIEHLKH